MPAINQDLNISLCIFKIGLHLDYMTLEKVVAPEGLMKYFAVIWCCPLITSGESGV